MANTNLMNWIQETLSKLGIPNSNVGNDNTLINGFCMLEGEDSPYGLTIKTSAECAVCYMMVQGADRAEDGVCRRIVAANLHLLKGSFNYDEEATKLFFKYLQPNIALADNEEAVKELVLLPAAMVKRYGRHLITGAEL